MMNSFEYLPDGSYGARFQWKGNHPALPTSFLTCVRQTRSLACTWPKLLICISSTTNPDSMCVCLLQCRRTALPSTGVKINQLITQSIRQTDQECCGFIEQVYPPADHRKGHYIPHHAVRKDSLTTLIRIVYDYSCHQLRDQPCLNDCLLIDDPQLNDL